VLATLQQLLQISDMSTKIPKIRISQEAYFEFEVVERSDWSAGVSLDSLVKWINWVAERFRPDEIGDSSRSSEDFTVRSFRHYQTLGCIDSPARVGRSARYYFRHYLQALLIRKLIWERVSSSQISRMMKERSNDELKRLLFEGVDIVSSDGIPHSTDKSHQAAERWIRQQLTPGVEIHLMEPRSKLGPEEVSRVLEKIRALLES
jgi:DNA-binding transcriptional MerR regulator